MVEDLSILHLPSPLVLPFFSMFGERHCVLRSHFRFNFGVSRVSGKLLFGEHTPLCTVYSGILWFLDCIKARPLGDGGYLSCCQSLWGGGVVLHARLPSDPRNVGLLFHLGVRLHETLVGETRHPEIK